MIETAPLISPAVNSGTIAFYVTGEPKGQPRPKAFARRVGAQWQARVYDPGTAENWKSLIAVAAQPHIPAQPLTGAIRLDLTFYFPRPKSHYRTGKMEGVLKDGAPHWHLGKPDIDNLFKAVADALTQINFWRDDSQVCCGLTMKAYPTHGKPAGCAVRIQPMEVQSDERQGELVEARKDALGPLRRSLVARAHQGRPHPGRRPKPPTTKGTEH